MDWSKIKFPDFSKILNLANIPNIEPPNLDMGDYLEHEAERRAQPFHTNDLLKELIDSQTPKWLNYIMLILVALTLGVSIWTLLHSYGIS